MIQHVLFTHTWLPRCSRTDCRSPRSGFARSASADVSLYSQTFDNAAGYSVDFSTVKWSGWNGNAIQLGSSGGTGTRGGVSSVNGWGGTPSYAFIYPGDTGNGGSELAHTTVDIAGSGFPSINQAAYSSLTFSWYQNVGDVNIAPQLEVEVGSTWYVGATTFKNSSTGTGGNFGTTAVLESTTLAAISNWYQVITGSASITLGTASMALPTTGNITGAGCMPPEAPTASLFVLTTSRSRGQQ